MPPRDHKAVVERCMRGFSTGDFGLLNGCFHEDYVRHVTRGLKGATSFAEHLEDMKSMRIALGGGCFEIDEIIAEGDTVAVRYSTVGTHSSEFMGAPPTGNAVRMAQISFFHFREGKIADSYTVSDIVGLRRQLGKAAG